MTLELTKISQLRSTVAEWRGQGLRVALVPTMGALHAGHFALVRAARAQADRVVVSIFVNPKQFGPTEDLDRYPRPLEEDLAGLKEAGADAAWLPSVAVMYPNGFATNVQVAGVSEGMDGAARPGHFDGVATVVAKLFNQVRPDVALFGEKDYQQLALIKRLVTDLDMDIKIIGVPTVREGDGLALSSRNRYLSAEERKKAVKLNQVLRHSAFVLKTEGRPVDETMEKARRLLLDAGFTSVDYVELRHAESLQTLNEYKAPARILAAATLGTTRLIDNVAVE
ncbi:MAG: pantoate--beta-alanine ligase [Azospirillum brasilense]|nr:MAG: pantoate--beta-alanine ligase [Azospirillum brasilense]